MSYHCEAASSGGNSALSAPHTYWEDDWTTVSRFFTKRPDTVKRCFHGWYYSRHQSLHLSVQMHAVNRQHPCLRHFRTCQLCQQECLHSASCHPAACLHVLQRLNSFSEASIEWVPWDHSIPRNQVPQHHAVKDSPWHINLASLSIH
jgi:hypothetical protein